MARISVNYLIVLLIITTAVMILPLYSRSHLFPNAFGEHGKEVFLSLYNSSFVPLTNAEGNQVSVFVKYEIRDPILVDEKLNAIMRVYTANGTLIKTSSYPSGFTAVATGGVEGLETTIRDKTIDSVTANVTFTDLHKTDVHSNSININLNLS